MSQYTIPHKELLEAAENLLAITEPDATHFCGPFHNKATGIELTKHGEWIDLSTIAKEQREEVES